MKDAGIFDGDFVIVEKRSAVNHDIIVALVDGESTLKRLVQRGNSTVLKPENGAFKEIAPKEELQVQGVVTAVFRTIK